MNERPRLFWISLLLLWPSLAFLNQYLITPSAGIPLWAALGAGLAVLALAPVLAWWPEPAPLVFGG